MEIPTPPRDSIVQTNHRDAACDEVSELTQAAAAITRPASLATAGPSQLRPELHLSTDGRNRPDEEASMIAPPATPTTSQLRTRRGRQTVQWPFQSVALDSVLWSPATDTSSFRRATWQPQRPNRNSDVFSIVSDLVPDYVVNYLRGDTPETVAQRKEQGGGTWGRRAVQVVAAHLVRKERSRIALLEDLDGGLGGDGFDGASSSRAGRSGDGGCGEKTRGWRRLLVGYQAGIALYALLSVLVFLAGLACFIVAVVQAHPLTGQLVIFSGSCATASSIDMGLHAAINILAVLLVGGANYVFQVLSSPTRAEVAAAHEKNRWLDVGVASVRNLAYIDGRRVVLGVLIVTAAVVTLVAYNAVIFISQSATDCELSLDGPLLGVVVLMNLVTFVTACAVLLGTSSVAPLVTLGDAIASFLSEPDPTTRGACLLTKTDVRQGRWGMLEARSWVPPPHTPRWFRIPSLLSWLLAYFFWAIPVGLAAGALALCMHATPTPFAAAACCSASLSSSCSFCFTLPLPLTTPAWAAALLASLPQLLLASLYLAADGLLTTMFLSREACLFALGRPRLLRVSVNPEGVQVTSLHLTLPLPWSCLLVALFAAMSFALSRAVVTVVTVRVLPTPGTTTPTPATIPPAVGFSAAPLVALLALLVLLAALVLALGSRRFSAAALVNGERPPGNPLALPGGSCSAVLSARCHTADGEADVWRQPLVWGVVRGDVVSGYAHCAFSAFAIGPLEEGRSYA